MSNLERSGEVRQSILTLQTGQQQIDATLSAIHSARQIVTRGNIEGEIYQDEQEIFRELNEQLYTLPSGVACIEIETQYPKF